MHFYWFSLVWLKNSLFEFSIFKQPQGVSDRMIPSSVSTSELGRGIENPQAAFWLFQEFNDVWWTDSINRYWQWPWAFYSIFQSVRYVQFAYDLYWIHLRTFSWKYLILFCCISFDIFLWIELISICNVHNLENVGMIYFCWQKMFALF